MYAPECGGGSATGEASPIDFKSLSMEGWAAWYKEHCCRGNDDGEQGAADPLDAVDRHGPRVGSAGRRVNSYLKNFLK